VKTELPSRDGLTALEVSFQYLCGCRVLALGQLHPLTTCNLGVRGPGNLVKNYGAAAIRRVWLATMVPRLDKNILITATMLCEGQNDPPQLYKSLVGCMRDAAQMLTPIP
jgi:hypothetical protein